MQLPPFLRVDSGDDLIRVEDSRIGLSHIVRLYGQGASAETILVHFPTLALSLIYKVLAYYLENQAEVDAYVAADAAELRRQEAEFDRSGRQVPTVAELKQRLDRLRPAAS